MNTDKGHIIGQTAKYRLIDVFTDLSWRMHTFGPDAVVTFSEQGWRIEDRKAKPTERRLIGVVSDLVEALKSNKPEASVSFDSRGWMNLV